MDIEKLIVLLPCRTMKKFYQKYVYVTACRDTICSFPDARTGSNKLIVSNMCSIRSFFCFFYPEPFLFNFSKNNAEKKAKTMLNLYLAY